MNQALDYLEPLVRVGFGFISKLVIGIKGQHFILVKSTSVCSWD